MRSLVVWLPLLLLGCVGPSEPATVPLSSAPSAPPAPTVAEAPATELQPAACTYQMSKTYQVQVLEGGAVAPNRGRRELPVPADANRFFVAPWVDDRYAARLSVRLLAYDATLVMERTFPGPSFQEPFEVEGPFSGPHAMEWDSTGYHEWGLHLAWFVCEPDRGPPFEFTVTTPKGPAKVSCAGLPSFRPLMEWSVASHAGPDASGVEEFAIAPETVAALLVADARTQVGQWSFRLIGPDTALVFEWDGIGARTNNVQATSGSPGAVPYRAPASGDHRYEWTLRGVFERAAVYVLALECGGPS